MGTKGGKPISTLEKKQKKIEKKEEKKPALKEEKREGRITSLDPSLINKVAEDIRGQPYVTTFSLVQKYGIKYGTAKAILRALADQKSVDVVLKTRRVIIAVPSRS